ncbi:hypothetical protein FOYG_08054 [Fusarium oxysporum NRRL 32931]|uniref:Uncharacterized protein n=1 Tax=Fusarium oxysporum NRRL 32931 TaxID=660029 RepID=W9IBD2_FUSOX|nr:hypothetical protein FOYG_08054 [Fusarium oxysporum NRRL 32931]
MQAVSFKIMPNQVIGPWLNELCGQFDHSPLFHLVTWLPCEDGSLSFCPPTMAEPPPWVPMMALQAPQCSDSYNLDGRSVPFRFALQDMFFCAWDDSNGPMYFPSPRVQQGFSRRLNNMALASNKPTPPLIPYAAQPRRRWLRHSKARLGQYGRR